MSDPPTSPLIECVSLEAGSVESSLATLDQGAAAVELAPGHHDEGALAVLEEAVRGRDPRPGTTVVVGRYGLVRATLAAWAERRSLPLVSAGPRASRGEPCLTPDLGEGLAVLPSLEACFLRHTEGLVSVRHLLAHALGGSSQLVVGCNRWAWRFLDRVAELGNLADRVVLLHLRLPPAQDAAAALQVAASVPEDPVSTALLYDLLLHESLSLEDLVEISPYPRARAQGAVAGLRRQGLVQGASEALALAPSQASGVVAALRLRGWINHG